MRRTAFVSLALALLIAGSVAGPASTAMAAYANYSPMAHAGGPYYGAPTGYLRLDGTGSADPNASQGDSIVSYEWDLDDDGLYDDAVGAEVVLPAAWVGANYRPGIMYVIALRVTDTWGAIGIAESLVTVASVAPPGGTIPTSYVLPIGGTLYLDGSRLYHPLDHEIAYEWYLGTALLANTVSPAISWEQLSAAWPSVTVGSYNRVKLIARDATNPNGPYATWFVRIDVIGAPDVLASQTEYNYGQVALGLSSSALFTITNPGSAPLNIAWSTDSAAFAAAGVTSAQVQPGQYFDIPVTFAPLTVGTTPGTLTITTNVPGKETIEVDLAGEGVLAEAPVEQEIQDLLAFYNAALLAESPALVGIGPGASATQRAKALRNMIEAAGDLLGEGRRAEAASQLSDVYAKCDGLSNPPDFVVGDARAALAAKILALIDRL